MRRGVLLRPGPTRKLAAFAENIYVYIMPAPRKPALSPAWVGKTPRTLRAKDCLLGTDLNYALPTPFSYPELLHEQNAKALTSPAKSRGASPALSRGAPLTGARSTRKTGDASPGPSSNDKRTRLLTARKAAVKDEETQVLAWRASPDREKASARPRSGGSPSLTPKSPGARRTGGSASRRQAGGSGATKVRQPIFGGAGDTNAAAPTTTVASCSADPDSPNFSRESMRGSIIRREAQEEKDQLEEQQRAAAAARVQAARRGKEGRRRAERARLERVARNAAAMRIERAQRAKMRRVQQQQQQHAEAHMLDYISSAQHAAAIRIERAQRAKVQRRNGAATQQALSQS